MNRETVIGETVTSETTVGEIMTGAAFAEAGLCGGPETILLVEDEAFVRGVTAEVLESAGYRLVIAGSAAEALDLYRRCSAPLDLLLADIVMPGMSGLELAAELENFHPRAGVLLMSGYVEQLASLGFSACGEHHLAKPFSVRVLLRRVREVLDKSIAAERRARSRLPCGNEWPAESQGEAGIGVRPGRGSPSPHKPEACRRPHNSARPAPP
jgi:CheY-like chemotaxis protein